MLDFTITVAVHPSFTLRFDSASRPSTGQTGEIVLNFRYPMLLATAGVVHGFAFLTPAMSQDTVRVNVGEFLVLRSVDFMTDEITYEWARTGDEVRPFYFLGTITGDDVEGYRTLELKCGELGLDVIVYFWPDMRDRPIRIQDRKGAERELGPPVPRTAPVQLRFDAASPGVPTDWPLNQFSAHLPRELVASFVERATPATRLRVQIGPYEARVDGFTTRRREDLEFSLLGFTRAVELLACHST